MTFVALSLINLPEWITLGCQRRSDAEAVYDQVRVLPRGKRDDVAKRLEETLHGGRKRTEKR